MGLRLPTWQELSKDEQIPIINLPLNKNYVVLGGPGTGKTIMALHRAAKWKDSIESDKSNNNDKKILFMVYNRTLQQYLDNALVAMNIDESKSTTWHSWFYKFYRDVTRESVPEINRYEPDWDKVLERIEKIPETDLIDHLILDESQDFPAGLLTVLNKFSKRATIFGDPNQAIFNNSTTMHFTNAFNAGGGVYHLSKNYRNTNEVALVANLFFTGDVDLIPALSKKSGEKPTIYKCSSYEKSIELISNYASNNPSLTIGVLIPNKGKINSNVKRYYEDIQKKTSTLVQCYVSGNKDYPLDFDADGVKILSYSTSKGLEFDTVFLPEIDNPLINNSDDVIMMNSLYVASSRARNKLIYIFATEELNLVMKMFNDNKGLLDWKEY